MFQRRTTEQSWRDTGLAIVRIGVTVAILSAVTAAIRRATRRSPLLTTEGRPMDETLTDVGPVDLAVVRFTGNKFTGEVAPALLDLVQAGSVRLLDALFVTRDKDGVVTSLEIGGLGADMRPAFVAIDGAPGVGLLDSEDVDEVGSTLEPNTSALLIVFENTWAARFAGAARRAGGELVDIARIPSQAVAQALAVLGDKPLGA
jgi:uncharacterized membrane protein